MPDIRVRIKLRAVRLAESAGWLTYIDRQFIDLFLSEEHATHAWKAGEHCVRRPRSVPRLRFHPAEAQLLLKRLLDLTLASVMLVLLLPLLIVAAFLIKLTSAGPVFIARKRVGLSGKPLRLYKFRTTRRCRKACSGTTRRSPRHPGRTRVGALLRMTKIDQFPLLLNVIKGDMSLVGPRPEGLGLLRYYLGSKESADAYRHIKPGIIEWSQVMALVDEDSAARQVEANLYYLQNWSLALDLKILCHAPRAWLHGIKARLASR